MRIHSINEYYGYVKEAISIFLVAINTVKEKFFLTLGRVSLLIPLLFLPAEVALSAQLKVEPYGEQDASLMPFWVEAGEPLQTTRDVVYVDESTMKLILSFIEERKSVSTDCRGSVAFLATIFYEGNNRSETVLCDGYVDILFDLLVQGFREINSGPPEWLGGIATALKARP